MCCQTPQSRPHHTPTSQQCGCHPPFVQIDACGCGCGMHSVMSKKKKIEMLKEKQSCLEEKLDDVKAFIKELES